MKITFTWKKVIIAAIIIVVVIFLILTALNIWIGYYGYGYDKARIYSDSKEESKKLGVFVRDVSFSPVKHLNIRDAYIEKAWMWKNVLCLSAKDLDSVNSKKNNSDMPYQLVIQYIPECDGFETYISYVPVDIKHEYLEDTIKLYVTISKQSDPWDSYTDTLKVWQGKRK